jgi:hypothetical protein
MRKIIAILIVTILLNPIVCVQAQTETLTNKEIILMTQAGLSKDLIVRKIKETKGNYDTSAESLIDLKKAGVSDDVIKLMMDSIKDFEEKNYSDSVDPSTDKISTSTVNNDSIYFTPTYKSQINDNSRIVLNAKESLQNAKTIAIKKSSLHPSRQALEKELLKRKEWKDLNLNIVRYKNDADLLIEIGYVSMSWITHRYVYRIYDNKSGTVILAGETTSWGSLAENLARGIAKRLDQALKNSK